MALLLHIDTSGSPGLAMLAKDGKIISSKSSEGEREHAAHINGMIADVLEEAKVGFGDLNAICVCNGPGSYTGLRIGLSTAKGLCYALSIPLITHNKLELLLASCKFEKQDQENLMALIPARAGEYFVAAEGENLEIKPCHLPQSELEILIKESLENTMITGIIPEDFQEFLKSNSVSVSFQEKAHFEVAVWASLSNARFLENNFANLAYCEPEYLKSAYILARSDGKNG
ncbi:MAG: tRNA (adenosine(37)-N6)-threonylcarbamoyltransferase complex dimerization subunit type 1 TsaB [Chitinophagaceae bacterium]